MIDDLKIGDYADVYGWPRAMRCVALDGPKNFKARMIDEDGHERYVADDDILHVLNESMTDLRDSTLYIVRHAENSLSNIEWTSDDDGLYVIHETVARRVARIDKNGIMRSWSAGNYIIPVEKFIKMDPQPVKSVRARTANMEFNWKLRV